MSRWPDPGDCSRCERLVAHRCALREAFPDYFNAPVGSWGARSPNLLIVGLAPGLHGAARTGKAFIGDASGTFLFDHLNRFGFAAPGPRLVGCRITNAVKCLPPANAPTGAEVVSCRSHLEAELAQFAPPRARRTRVVLVLGGTAYRAVSQIYPGKQPRFAHGVEFAATPRLWVIGAYHPSRLNVNTGRLTSDMFSAVLARVRELCGPGIRAEDSSA